MLFNPNKTVFPQQLIKRPFKLTTFYLYATQLCDALAYLHYGFRDDASIIHR